VKYWADQGFQWHRPHVSLEKPVVLVVQETIMRLARGLMKRGMKRMHAILLLPQYDYLRLVSATDVSDCEILCYDPAVIPMMALLHPSRFFLFLLMKQFDSHRATVPVQFSPVFLFTNTRSSRPVMTAITFVFWTDYLGI
jgi:hypothetical protein